MRAWDLCEALDLPTLPKNTEGIRAKLKRLASRGILAEPEPGLFVQPRPWQQPRARDQRASPNHNHETDMGAARFE